MMMHYIENKTEQIPFNTQARLGRTRRVAWQTCFGRENLPKLRRRDQEHLREQRDLPEEESASGTFPASGNRT